MAEQNPLAKYELRRAGGSARNTEGMFTNDNGNAARDARRAAKREARPMTYAEMQQAGIARPAPANFMQSQPFPVSQMFTGQDASSESEYELPPDYGTTTPISGWSGQVDTSNLGPYSTQTTSTTPSTPSMGPWWDRYVAPLLPPGGGGTPAQGTPSGTSGLPMQFPYNDDIYKAQRNSALANLEAQFGLNRRSLEEDMARRGLSASSVGAERLSDLFGQQERTRASLEAQLLADEDARRRAYLDYYLRMLPIVAQGKS